MYYLKPKGCFTNISIIMIEFKRREECCGCGACEQVCPKHCISLIPDREGYWYPHVDTNACIDCHLCEIACPVINQEQERTPIKVYAAINKNERIRAKSASGGIFTIVAEKVIGQGGVVFGVKFDDGWNVVFDYTESIEGLDAFRRSKYVQAWLGDTYSNVRDFLKKGRLVLFVGTPCQVAGLRRFLKRNYTNLLLMDLLCEGVPSPKVWKMYLEEEIVRLGEKNTVSSNPISKKNVLIKDISFRNKSLGWKKFSFALTFAKATADGESNSVLSSYINRDSAYMQAMFQYLDLRPICYECPFKSCKSHSDITIADYWGINSLHPEMDDDKGVSMVYINTEKGAAYYDADQTNYIETPYDEAFRFNNVITSSRRHPYRDKFFSKIDECDSVIQLLQQYTFTRSFIIKKEFKNVIRTALPEVSHKYVKWLWKKVKR